VGLGMPGLGAAITTGLLVTLVADTPSRAALRVAITAVASAVVVTTVAASVVAAADSTAVVVGSAAATVVGSAAATVAAAADTGKQLIDGNGWPRPAVSFCALLFLLRGLQIRVHIWSAPTGYIVPTLAHRERRIQAKADGKVRIVTKIQYSAGKARTGVGLAGK
jgi:hypothetical protein